MLQTGFQSTASYKLKDIETNFGWRPHCDNQQCQQASYVRFLLVDANSQYTRSLCSHCTANFLAISQQQLSICDTYVKSAKPLFQRLRVMEGTKPPHANSHRDISGYFNISIGDQHVLIKEYKCCRYMLSINWVLRCKTTVPKTGSC